MSSNFYNENTSRRTSYLSNQPSDYNIDLSSRMAYSQKDDDWVAAQSYLQNGEILELKIVEQNRGGLIVKFGQLQGFIPNSQIPNLASGNHDTLKKRKVGSLMPVAVIEADKKRNRLIFTAKLDAQEYSGNQWAQGFEVGQILTGRIINLVEFGAFADIGNGINGLIHISELAWRRVTDPAEVVKVDETVKVRIQEIDYKRRRISLSRKAVRPNPWIDIKKRYRIGDLVEGVVTTEQRFGFFVELGAGVEGLLHRSEIPFGGSILGPEDVIPGEKILLRITNIEARQQRISLSLQLVTIEEQISWLMHRHK